MALPAISPTGVATPYLYPTQTGQGLGLTAVFGAAPGSANPPIIFEPGPELTGNRRQIFIILTGQAPDWGGAQVHVSIDDVTYVQSGTISSGGTQGLLTAGFPAGADPDTLNTLAVDISQSGSGSQIIAATVQDADDYLSLAYVGNGTAAEVVAYSAATLTGPGQYQLGTYLRRGVYAPQMIASHATGAQFGLIDGATFREEYSKRLIGKTIYFKFPSFNRLGAQLEDIAHVPFYTYTLTGVGGTRPWVQSFSVGGAFADLSPDEWDGNYEIFDVEMLFDTSWPPTFGTSPLPGCEIAPSSNVMLVFQHIHAGVATPVGALSIVAGATTGSFIFPPLTVPAGDRLRLYADAAVDTVIAGLFGTIAGTYAGD